MIISQKTLYIGLIIMRNHYHVIMEIGGGVGTPNA